jgi:hypothetical protein
VDAKYPKIINLRYNYGEIRLGLLNMIFRVRSISQGSFRSVRTGFFQEPDWYTRFLRENFSWFILVFGYLAIVLNAMHVGL